MRTSPSPIAAGRPRFRGRRVVAAVLAAALAAVGLSVAGTTPALAAGPTVSAPEVPALGGAVTVTGSGFAATAPGVYLGLGPAALAGFYPGSASLLPSETVWIGPGNSEAGSGAMRTAPLNADGTFSVTLTIPAPTAAVPAYAIYTSKAHGMGSADPSQNTVTALSYAAPAPAETTLSLSSSAVSVEAGQSVTLTATVAPAAEGSVTFSDGATALGTETVSGGATSLSTSVLAVGSHSITASFVPADPAASAPSTSNSVTVAVTAPAAVAAVALSATSGLDPAGSSLTVTGSHFKPTGAGVFGVYAGIGPKAAKDNADWFAVGGYYSPVAYVSSVAADGTFTTTLNTVKQQFSSNGRAVDCATEECGVYTFAARGSADRSQDTYTPISFAVIPDPAETTLTLTSSAASVQTGRPVTLTATVAPAAAGSVQFFDGAASLGSAVVASGVATLKTSALGVGSHSLTAAFTPADATIAAPSTAPAVTVAVTAAPIPGVPTVSAPAVPSGGGTITVTGTGFATSAPGIYLALGPAGFSGFYAGSSSMVTTETIWIATGNPEVTTGTARTAPMNADGSFSVTVTVPGFRGDAASAVYTSKAHGAGLLDTSQNTVTNLSYAVPNPGVTPTSLAVTVGSASSKPGGSADVTITVTPGADGLVTLYDRGQVVTRDLRLVRDASRAATVPPAGGVATQFVLPASATGSSSVTTRVAALTSGNHVFSASFTPDDPTAFAPSVSPAVTHVVEPAEAVVTEVAPVAVPEPVCIARTVSGATLGWGVKSSFRTYISGGIANGSWSLAGVGYADGRFGWTGGAGSVNSADSRGLVRFPGSVSFTGHDGVLNLVLSNIAIRVSGAGSATLIADVHSTDMSGKAADFSGVSFATIRLSGSTGPGSTFSASGAPATLTEAGAKAFAGFYSAGAELDPVSFRFPLGAQVECDSSTAPAGSRLAATGGGDSGDGPLFGGLLVLAGIAAVAVARRRSIRAAEVR